MSDSKPQLGYAPPPPPHRRRRFYKWLVVITLILAVPATLKWVPFWWNRVRVVYLQSRCMNFVAPPQQTIFQEVPSKIRVVPAPYSEFQSRSEPGSLLSSGTAFLHERTRGDIRRLVAVDIVFGPINDMCFYPRLYKPATLFSAAETITPQSVVRLPDVAGRLSGPGDVIVYAGVADPADKSHFTIDVRRSDKKWIVHGYLVSDSAVKLELVPVEEITPPPPPSAAKSR